jgi:hypothetical protein
LDELEALQWPAHVEVVVDVARSPIVRPHACDRAAARVAQHLQMPYERQRERWQYLGATESSIVSRLGALAGQLEREWQQLSRRAHRVAILAAGRVVFDRPRSELMTLLRVFAFGHALRTLGYTIEQPIEGATIQAIADASWPGEWIDRLIVPTPPRVRPLVGRSEPCGEPRTDARVTGWLEEQKPGTRAHYETVIDRLTEWRAELGIDPASFSAEQIDTWGEELIRQGAATATAAQAQLIARGFYSRVMGEPRTSGADTVGPSREPQQGTAFLVDPYAAQAFASIDEFIHGDGRPESHSQRALRLMRRFGWDDEAFVVALDACRLTHDQGLMLDKHLPGSRARRAANRARMTGSIFLLRYGIAPGALPREVRAGSGWTVASWIRSRRADDTWPKIVAELAVFDEYSDVDWHRPI